jgi:UDP-glucose 4-epimerase
VPYVLVVSPQPSVLVLGAGFVGAAVARSLVRRGCQVKVLTRSEPTHRTAEVLVGATVAVGDAGEMTTLVSALGGVDRIVYALGSASPAESDLDPASDVAVVIPPLVRMLELLRLRSGLRTFLSSGGAVYGEQREHPIPESVEPRPISSYGIIKLTCEKYLTMYSDSYGIPCQVLRIANVYGPGQHVSRGQGVVARLAHSALTGAPMPLYSGGKSVRDYVYIDDVADAVADLVCVAHTPQVINIGTGIGHSLDEVVEQVRIASGKELNLLPLESRTFDVHSNVLDPTLLSGLVPFAPRNLAEGVAATWADLQSTAPSELAPPTAPRAPGLSASH